MTQKPYRHWNSTEIAMLKQEWVKDIGELGKNLAKLFDRSHAAVRTKAKRLGLRKNKKALTSNESKK